MRIAQIPPLFETVPPKLYGGTERVVAHLCDELVQLGHDVTLFAAADARTRARLCVVRDEAIRLDNTPLKSELASHLAMLHEVRRRAGSFDILHFHTDLLHFPMFESYAGKCLTTLHGRLDIKDLSRAYERWPGFGLVSISDAQRRPLPQANWVATVPHGVPGSLYQFVSTPGDYLAFLGRISPEKGPAEAIRLAIRAGVPLKIAAKVDRVDRAYFESEIKPLLAHPLIEFVGEIGDADKSAFLGQARALLFPIDWPEPFGLVMIEAMACGTPVIAYDSGSVREVVAQGRSGFIASGAEEALAAIARCAELPRRAVREDYERRFTARTMAEAYVEVYAAMSAPRKALARIAAGM
ncbi:MAG TPA: glycosyltransferase family 4 protein [Candidatus Dormibacteraeota bacterium]|nr:glycosyltransferase family 4 protein [Candidatus Dormibacteraeota bacterium]